VEGEGIKNGEKHMTGFELRRIQSWTLLTCRLPVCCVHHTAPRCARRRPAGAGIIKSISDQVAALRASQGRKSLPEDRVAILYNDASSFTVSTMESAEKYARDLDLTPVVRAYNGTAYPPGRILTLLQEVKAEGIRWLLVMALDPDGLDAARAIQDNGLELYVKWVTIAPGGKFFLPKMGARGAEFFMVRCSLMNRPGRRRIWHNDGISTRLLP
jgi:hypothetical protein